MADLKEAAASAWEALSNAPDYCAQVAQDGSAVNVAIHNFKVAWNEAYAASATAEIVAIGPVPIGTGNFEQQTWVALSSLVQNPPAPCPERGQPTPTPKPTPQPQPEVPATTKGGLPTWAMWALGLLIAAGLITGGVWLYRRAQKGHKMLGFGAAEKKKRKKGKKR